MLVSLFCISCMSSSVLARLGEWLRPPARLGRDLYIGVLIGVSLTLSTTSVALHFRSRRNGAERRDYEPTPIDIVRNEVVQGVTGLVGEAIHNRVLRSGSNLMLVVSRKHASRANQFVERRSGCRNSRKTLWHIIQNCLDLMEAISLSGEG